MKSKRPAPPRLVFLDQKVHFRPSVHTKRRMEDLMEGIRIGQKRPRPKSDPAIEMLRRLYPPDGKPPQTKVSDFQVESAYQAECDRLKVPTKKRASRSQLMRCVGRKD
jgi:hypothetical protein